MSVQPVQVGMGMDGATHVGAGARMHDAYEALLKDEQVLLISVVLPLPDSRGWAMDSVRSWACEQTFPRDRYEVLIVADGSEPELEAAVAAMLRPHDRILYGPPGNEARLYDLGARQARGRWIFFTESHCLGARDCLEEIARYLAGTGLDGASCRSEGIAESPLARMELRYFDQIEHIRMGPAPWFYIRGAAISREVLLRHGGIAWRYDLFSEPELSARLHATGCAIGYAPAAAIYHAGMDTVAEMRCALEDYGRGECKYRLEHPHGELDAYFGMPGWWSDRGLFDPRVERHLWLSLLRCLASPASNRPWLRREWLRLLPAFLFGNCWRLWRMEWRTRWAALRCWWWRHQEHRLGTPYRELWADLAVRGSLRELADAGAFWERTDPAIGDAYLPAELPGEWLTGFHAVEQLDGEGFRWAGPLACLKLPLAPGDGVLRLRTRGVRPGLRVRAFLNGRRLAVHDRQAERGEIELAVRQRHFRAGRFQYLVLACDPLKPWLHGVPDQRELGVPLFRVSFEARGRST